MNETNVLHMTNIYLFNINIKLFLDTVKLRTDNISMTMAILKP